MRITIRPATKQDAAAIAQIIYDSSVPIITDEFDEEATAIFLSAATAEAISYYMDNGTEYHIAECNGRAIGTVGIDDKAHLFQLFVLPEFHRRGLASYLWNHGKDHYMEHKSTTYFTVNSSNFAVRFYEKLGFQRTGPMEEKKGVKFNPMRLCLASA